MPLKPSADLLNKLKCSKCDCYLSVPPITHTPTGDNHCGRCSEDGNITNEVFQVLAAEYEFPCRYSNEGCKMDIPFGLKVTEHEKVCNYQSCSCPVGEANCDWKGTVANSYEHCSEKHQDDVLKSLTVDINLQESIKHKYLVRRDNGDIVLLDVVYNANDGLTATLRPMLPVREPFEFYSLTLTSENKKSQSHFAIFKNGECISKTVLNYVDEKSINIQLYIPHGQGIDEISVHKKTKQGKSGKNCIDCKEKLSQLNQQLFACHNEHYVCSKCRDCGERCKICACLTKHIEENN